MALLEFFRAAAGAGIIPADVFQCIAYRLLVAVVAVWAMHVAVMMIVVVVAVRTMDMGFLAHEALLRNKIAGNYLAISLQVHAASEQQAGFHLALQAITNGLVGLLQ